MSSSAEAKSDSSGQEHPQPPFWTKPQVVKGSDRIGLFLLEFPKRGDRKATDGLISTNRNAAKRRRLSEFIPTRLPCK